MGYCLAKYLHAVRLSVSVRLIRKTPLRMSGLHGIAHGLSGTNQALASDLIRAHKTNNRLLYNNCVKLVCLLSIKSCAFGLSLTSSLQLQLRLQAGAIKSLL